MCEKIKIVPLNRELYPLYYQMVQNTPWGNPMLPSTYEFSLWGAIVLDKNNVIGGWVGMVKGNSPIVGFLTKCVYFDSYPIFVSNDVKKLDLSYVANDKNASVKIVGNENFVEGNNEVEIIVSNSDNDSKAES